MSGRKGDGGGLRHSVMDAPNGSDLVEVILRTLKLTWKEGSRSRRRAEKTGSQNRRR